jgi:hypothetical protein
VNIKANEHGMRSRVQTDINGSTLTIKADGKGIRAAGNNNGRITVINSTLNINTVRDALQAEVNINLNKTNMTAVVGNGWKGGPTAGISKRALRAGGDIEVNGGTFDFNCAEDAVYASGFLTVKGKANMTLMSGRTALDAKLATVVRDSNITIPYCNIGLKGSSVTVQNGSFLVHFLSAAVSPSDITGSGFKESPKGIFTNNVEACKGPGCHIIPPPITPKN